MGRSMRTGAAPRARDHERTERLCRPLQCAIRENDHDRDLSGPGGRHEGAGHRAGVRPDERRHRRLCHGARQFRYPLLRRAAREQRHRHGRRLFLRHRRPRRGGDRTRPRHGERTARRDLCQPLRLARADHLRRAGRIVGRRQHARSGLQGLQFHRRAGRRRHPHLRGDESRDRPRGARGRRQRSTAGRGSGPAAAGQRPARRARPRQGSRRRRRSRRHGRRRRRAPRPSRRRPRCCARAASR